MERRRTDGTRRDETLRGENRWRDIELTALGEETLRERSDGET